jgi:acyl carrier protein
MRAWLEAMVDDPQQAALVQDETNLLADGVIDSFGMLELLTWVEERFGVFVDFADDDNLRLLHFGALADHVAERAVDLDAA